MLFEDGDCLGSDDLEMWLDTGEASVPNPIPESNHSSRDNPVGRSSAMDFAKRRYALEAKKGQLEAQLTHLRKQLQEVNRNLQALDEEQRTPQSFVDYTSGTFAWSDALRRRMREVFNIPSFRLCQEGVCNANMDNRDVVVVMPTGGGKSLTYQLPAIIQPGVTVVISPLISLISDQIIHLMEANIDAVKMTGTNTPNENREISRRINDIVTGRIPPGSREIKLIYTTPEKVAKSTSFQASLQKLATANKLARIVIDEAHCVSQLGHDFRPDYSKLHLLRKLMPHVPIMALSATCPPKVLEDLVSILKLQRTVPGSAAPPIGTVYFSAPLYRANLLYTVLPKPTDNSALLKHMVDFILDRYPNDSGIIYCLSKKDTESVATGISMMSGAKIKTGVYHADRNDGDREKLHHLWRDGQIKVVCATIAFGLGIDKGDVRFVMHHTVSKSMDGFYQESGRAGRDGKNADCILYYSPSDFSSLCGMVYSEKQGFQKLAPIFRFAQDLQACRKIQFAQYFNHSANLPTSAWSNDETDSISRCGHCDNCIRPAEEVDHVDVSVAAWKLIRIAQEKSYTVRQLAEVARKKKTQEMDLQMVCEGPVELDRTQVEQLIVHLLTVANYLKVTYKANNYSSIANVYLQPTASGTKYARQPSTALSNPSSDPVVVVFRKSIKQGQKKGRSATQKKLTDRAGGSGSGKGRGGEQQQQQPAGAGAGGEEEGEDFNFEIDAVSGNDDDDDDDEGNDGGGGDEDRPVKRPIRKLIRLPPTPTSKKPQKRARQDETSGTRTTAGGRGAAKSTSRGKGRGKGKEKSKGKEKATVASVGYGVGDDSDCISYTNRLEEVDDDDFYDYGDDDGEAAHHRQDVIEAAAIKHGKSRVVLGAQIPAPTENNGTTTTSNISKLKAGSSTQSSATLATSQPSSSAAATQIKRPLDPRPVSSLAAAFANASTSANGVAAPRPAKKQKVEVIELSDDSDVPAVIPLHRHNYVRTIDLTGKSRAPTTTTTTTARTGAASALSREKGKGRELEPGKTGRDGEDGGWLFNMREQMEVDDSDFGTS